MGGFSNMGRMFIAAAALSVGGAMMAPGSAGHGEYGRYAIVDRAPLGERSSRQKKAMPWADAPTKYRNKRKAPRRKPKRNMLHVRNRVRRKHRRAGRAA